MRLVFVPHQSFEQNYRQREHYLIEEMADHICIDAISWTWGDTLHAKSVKEFLDVRKAASGLKYWKTEGTYNVHHIRRLVYPPIIPRTINQALFRSDLRKILSQGDVDAIILGPSAEIIGFPRMDTKTPVIFDYSDYLKNRRHLKRYLKLAKAVICVSKALVEDASALHDNVQYLPNGVDIEKFQSGRRAETRQRLGIAEGVTVIGLIGATASSTLFFLDAYKDLGRLLGDFVFLIVGESPLTDLMKDYSSKKRIPAVFTGWVTYDHIQDYYAAIDCGVYPVDQNVYFDSAFPIKVLEYTAARRPVVSTDIREVRSLGFPNIRLCKPNPENFTENILDALNHDGSFPSLDSFSWKRISAKLEEIVESVKPN